MNIDAKAREIANLFCEPLKYAYEREAVEIKIAAALRSVRNEALEEAAKVACHAVEDASKGCDPHFKIDPDEIATAIRALKQE